MEFISVVELIGTVAFAVSGALVAIDKELDYYGIAFFAIITAVGGGIIRDMLIDASLPAALENPLYVIISIASAAVVIYFYRKIILYKNILLPFVFRKEIYAVASIIGAICFIIIGEFSGNNTVALYSCFGITLIIRLGCMKKDIHLKKVEKEDFL